MIDASESTPVRVTANRRQFDLGDELVLLDDTKSSD
jgi:hypothetical protein